LAEAQARAEAEGLADRVSFQLLDYRAVDQSFDRIVSVGMFEHVGVFHYRAFYDTVSRCLKPDGVALLQFPSSRSMSKPAVWLRGKFVL
jgi:cyclopropane-fatty-acyl-phospholipid synthase